MAAWWQQLKAYPELQTAVRGVEKAVGCSQQTQLKDACARYCPLGCRGIQGWDGEERGECECFTRLKYIFVRTGRRREFTNSSIYNVSNVKGMLVLSHLFANTFITEYEGV